MIDTITCADCMIALPLIPDSSIHLTVFSPPYDNLRTYGSGWEINLPALGVELLRVTVDGGMCCMVIQDSTKDFAKSLTSFRTIVGWVDAGWRLFECCIYERSGVPGNWWKQRFRVDHEYIAIFLKGARPRVFDKVSLMIDSINAGKIYSGRSRRNKNVWLSASGVAVANTKCRGTVWHINSSNHDCKYKKHQHPATFPDLLAADLIHCFSQPSDIILDPMCGSGTTCVQAKKLGRRYIGVEINEEYVGIAQELVDGVSVPVHPLLRLAQVEKDPVRRAMLIRSYSRAKAAMITQ